MNKTIPLLLFALLLLLVGCRRESADLSGPPEGWEHEDGRWWMAGVDTSEAFRDLETLAEMGVTSDAVFASTRALAQDRSLQQGQLTQAVRQSLIRLYRNAPEVVDSLYQEKVVPSLEDADLQKDPDELVETRKKRAYTLLRRHFREPVPALELGEDVPVVYPDSLRRQGIGGPVKMQVRLNAEGEPVAIELLDGSHPVLNELAVRTTTQMRWQPAYVLRKGEWVPQPSWARYTIRYAVPDTE